MILEREMSEREEGGEREKKAADSWGDYEIHTAREGFASVRHVGSGEIMHSRTPPFEEAEKLYVEQSRLEERLGEDGAGALVLWDVGLGAGANAMAAIQCFLRVERQGKRKRELVIYSFENDLDSFRLALRNAEKFPYLRQDIAEVFLREGRWCGGETGGIRWELIEGDFVEVMEEAPEPPELIFYDLFSGKTHPEAWAAETFEKLFRVCGGGSMELVTYTCSTAARAAMLGAGFWVACGRNAGEKKETTIGLTARGVRRRHELLGEAWLSKWRRSTARFPWDVKEEDFARWEEKILGAAQFWKKGEEGVEKGISFLG